MVIEHSTRGNFVSFDNGINMIPLAQPNLFNDEDDDLYKFDPDKEPWWNR